MDEFESTAESELSTTTTKPEVNTSEENTIIVDKLTARLQTGQKVLNQCIKNLEQTLKVNGKTLKQWGEELTVTLPEDAEDISGLEEAQNKIANAYQTANYLYAIFDMRASTISNFHEAEFAKKYVQQMEAHSGTKFAAEKIKQLVLVDSDVDASLSASQVSSLIAEFFKKIVRSLEEARKAIENRGRFLTLRRRLE